MSAKSYSLLAGILFLIVAAGHAARLFMHVKIVLGSHMVPVHASWIGLAVSGILGILGVMASRK